MNRNLKLVINKYKLNEFIWHTFCPEQEYIWVNFKVWGILPLTIIFTIFQIPIINKYKLNE